MTADELFDKADYQHAFHATLEGGEVIDMHGLVMGQFRLSQAAVWHDACRHTSANLWQPPSLPEPFKLPLPPKPRYPLWYRAEMTLCIAALATEPSPFQPCIVLCFDYKVSNDAWGSESEYKLHVLNEQVVALYSGSPGRAKELAELHQEVLKNRRLTLATATTRLRGPLARLKRRLAESYVGVRLGVSYREFRTHGPAWYGAVEFGKRLSAIENHDLNVDIIIAGFVDGHAVLYQAAKDGDGRRELQRQANFCMVGTGGYTAEPALHARKHVFTTTLAQALFNVYEAKRIGELSPSVGTKTRMIVLSAPEQGSHATQVRKLTPAGEKWLRNLFARYGQRRIKKWIHLPQDALEIGRSLTSPISSLLAIPVMRTVARTELPSTKAAITCARVLLGN